MKGLKRISICLPDHGWRVWREYQSVYLIMVEGFDEKINLIYLIMAEGFEENINLSTWSWMRGLMRRPIHLPDNGWGVWWEDQFNLPDHGWRVWREYQSVYLIMVEGFEEKIKHQSIYLYQMWEETCLYSTLKIVDITNLRKVPALVCLKKRYILELY